MEFSKKLNKRITTLILISISIIIFINLKLMGYSSDKISEKIGQAHYNQTIESINHFTDMLKAATENVASNEVIISLLDKNRDVNDFSKEDIALIENQIDIYESILKPIAFIKTINILSIEGKYLFSNGVLYDEFDIKTISWLKEEYLHNYNDTIITEIHRGFSTEEHSVSVVKLIQDSSTNKILGVAVLDIFVEDLLKYIDNRFYLGTLNSYVEFDNDTYLSKHGKISENTISNKNTLTYSDEILDDKLSIVLNFDKDSMISNQQMKKINKTISGMLIILGMASIVTLVIILRLMVKPIMNSLDKLKVLLSTLEKNNFDLDLCNEVEQLEFISESLSKSFDKKIQSLIYYDELTSLPNRKMLLNISNELIKNNVPFALLFIDLNNFKYVNDIFGHSVGDELLVNFSRMLEGIFKDKGLVTRYSGDEFVIIYDKYTTDNEVLDFYNNFVLKEFERPISFNNNNILVEFSVGVAVYPRDGETFDDLIRKSDFMMYNCKKTRDSKSLLFFNDSVYTKILKIEDIKLELKKALEKDEFLVYYQPIVSKDTSINKVEALIRWQSGKFGLVSPGEFINYAEESGEIVPIGYWVIEEVCKNFSTLCKDNPNLQISINVSPVQLMIFDFAENVKTIVEKYNMDFKNLCFEITESIVLDEHVIVYDNIHLLHKMGASIALDDFGTGYSSFGYLEKYKLDLLKIDRMFINNINNKSFGIVENIKNIAHILDMDVVIEGVETEEQFKKLNNIGCDYFQGYYFSKPVTFEELKTML